MLNFRGRAKENSLQTKKMLTLIPRLRLTLKNCNLLKCKMHMDKNDGTSDFKTVVREK
jgi:hypothetical protein